VWLAASGYVLSRWSTVRDDAHNGSRSDSDYDYDGNDDLAQQVRPTRKSMAQKQQITTSNNWQQQLLLAAATSNWNQPQPATTGKQQYQQ